ncbi:hypothetical protein A9Q78_00740 [Methylophaga sp. 41_12_T18]|nr:hypothetical protein A9Q78_00740 [Methylophaga sp. 41_12_T18]
MAKYTTPDSVSGPNLEAIYIEHSSWLKHWLQQHLGCAERAADMAQDTFVRILTKKTAPIIETPRAYLSTIAHGLVVNHWRRQALEQAYLELIETQEIALQPSEEDTQIVIEKLEQLALALDGLSSRSKHVFLYARLDNMTYPQIAKKMDITVNMVQKAMGAAMKNCYRALYG